MGNIAIYGGSFDPPHKGHKLLAENLAKECNANKVIIIPAYSSPFKDGTVADSADRLTMCRHTFTDPIFEISSIEINREGKSYTVDTIKDIKKYYPNDNLFLFMGDDMFLSLANWYKYQELLSLCTIVTATRTEDLRYLSEMKTYAITKLKLHEGDYIISKEKPLEVSSTLLRTMLRNKMDTSKYLTYDVIKYINKRGLYL
ncbi:MAG: nicotinate (nicotinamide) nucleotide adenylyltransferase [Clostridia bacterium]|nr:nicotinate (nicotinamide) nucleotide adenylyltransferase [Clostridia bacterium]